MGLLEKCIFRGNATVFFSLNSFSYERTPTISAAYSTQTIETAQMQCTVQTKTLKAVRPVQGVNFPVVVYSVVDPGTYTNAVRWMEVATSALGDGVQVVLVGNKCEEWRGVTVEEAVNGARSAGAGFVEVSARLGWGIDMLFCLVVAMGRTDSQL